MGLKVEDAIYRVLTRVFLSLKKVVYIDIQISFSFLTNFNKKMYVKCKKVLKKLSEQLLDFFNFLRINSQFLGFELKIGQKTKNSKINSNNSFCTHFLFHKKLVMLLVLNIRKNVSKI